jgi:hypothetical protein
MKSPTDYCSICGSNSVVECLLAKEDVASSSLVSRSIFKRSEFNADLSQIDFLAI